LWLSSFGWIATNVVVAATGLYYFAAGAFLNMAYSSRKSLLITEIVLQALFVTLVAQLWDTSGFDWYFLTKPHGPIKATLMFLFVVFALLILMRTQSFGFARTAEMHSNTLLLFVTSNDSRRAIKTGILITVAAVVVWQLLSSIGAYLVPVSALNVLKAAISLLTKGGSAPAVKEAIWGDIAVSLLEIFIGLGVAGVAAILLYRGLVKCAGIRNPVFAFLPLTYVTPIVFLPFAFELGLAKGFWLVTATVSCFSFFPFVRVVWGLRTWSEQLKILLAVVETLPYAFVAMLVGDTINSFAGLGFAIIMVQTDSTSITEAAAILFITFVVLALLSLLVTFLAGLEYRRHLVSDSGLGAATTES
jgi:hypothetical protein